MQFDFTDQQLNTVINALIERPFKEVVEVMDVIRGQIMSQQPKPPVAPDNVVPLQSGT